MSENQTFGDAVGEARSMLSLSRSAAAERLGMPESMLEDIEVGIIPPNPALIAAFEESYEINFDLTKITEREHAPRKPLEYDPVAGVLTVGSMKINHRAGVDDNNHLFGQFSGAVRRLRRLAPSTPVKVRSADLPMLAQLADLEDPELDERARFWFGQDLVNGQSFASLLRLSRPPEANAA